MTERKEAVRAWAIQTPAGGIIGFCAPTEMAVFELAIEWTGKPPILARQALLDAGWKAVPVEIRPLSGGNREAEG